MGRVFSLDQLLHNELPSKEDFLEFHRFAKDLISANQFFRGALVYGSFLWQQDNPRSDYDLMVVFTNASPAHHDLELLSQKADSLHIPLNLLAIDVEITGTLICPLDQTILPHLQMAADHGGIIDGDPLRGFPVKFDRPEIRQLFLNYFRHIIANLYKNYFRRQEFKEDEFYRLLKKSLELPVHVARKMLYFYHGGLMYNDSKSAVTNEYLNLGWIDRETRKLFKGIVSIDNAYTNFINETLKKGEVDHQMFLYLRGVISKNILNSIRFVQQNALIFARM